QCGLHHLIASCDFGHHLDILFPAQQGSERTTHHRLVFRQQHSDHECSSCKTAASPPRWTGSSTRTRKCSLPDTVREPASIRPPSTLTRSRRPASPRPGRTVLPTCSRWPPSLSTSAVTAPFLWVNRMRHCRAQLWRMTLVTPSRTVQARAASKAGEMLTSLMVS